MIERQDQRMAFTLTAAERRLIEEAARREQRTVSQLIRIAAVKSANEIMERVT